MATGNLKKQITLFKKKYIFLNTPQMQSISKTEKNMLQFIHYIIYYCYD